jgi:DNA repair protein RadC
MQKAHEIKVQYNPPVDLRTQPFIKCSKDAFNVLLPHFNADTLKLQEQFLVCYLSRNNQVKGVFSGFKGGVTGTVADVRIILAIALKTASTSLILAHNHPSGNITPSESDRELTSKIKIACSSMEIMLLDHLIITPYSDYLSFADEGLI